jgi:hypothetical protein
MPGTQRSEVPGYCVVEHLRPLRGQATRINHKHHAPPLLGERAGNATRRKTANESRARQNAQRSAYLSNSPNFPSIASAQIS